MGSGASSHGQGQSQISQIKATKTVVHQHKCTAINDHKSLLPIGYRLIKTIGEGSFGKVKRAFSVKHGKDVAVKIIDCREKNKLYHARFFRREKQVSYLANHKNIVKCHEIVECGHKIYFILEYMDNGNLFRYVKKKRVIEECVARNLFVGISSALSYLHSKHVAHRDLKLENILLSKDLTPKISDFGFAKTVRDSEHKSLTFCGSRMYSCLEILTGVPYNIFKADIWSLGVILFTMLTGHFPFADFKELVKMKDGVSFIGSKQDVSHEAVQLIRKMLHADPNSRLSIHEVFRHVWVKKSCV